MVLSMVQFVMIPGMNWKLKLFVHNLDSCQKVSHMISRIIIFLNNVQSQISQFYYHATLILILYAGINFSDSVHYCI